MQADDLQLLKATIKSPSTNTNSTQSTTAKYFGVVLALLFIAAPGAFGCTCVPPPPGLNTRRAFAEWQIRNSTVIFEGKVAKVSLKNWPVKLEAGKTFYLRPALLVSFSNVHVYRGDLPNQFVIETGMGGGDCGYPFVNGKSYLVDAWADKGGHLTTGLCSATSRLEDAATVLRLVRNEPPAADDLADIRNVENDSPKVSVEPQLCGKLEFPKGRKPGDVRVLFWRAEQREMPVPVDEADTQDDGSFCIGSLDPGRYIIGAVEEADSDSQQFRYASYYPGVRERAHALPVVVPEKGAMPRVEFALMRTSLHAVRGYVRNAPVGGSKNLKVLLLNIDPDFSHQVEPIELGPNGFFEFHSVPSGTYSAAAVRVNDDDDSATCLSTVAPVNVESDVNGVTLEFVPKQ